MENVMPEFSPEQLNKVVEEKAKEIYEMFKTAINDQITDSVTISPELIHNMSKACALTHIKPFKNPLEKIPADKLNGAAMERLELVVEFWKGIDTYLTNM